ncbi:MAG: DUF3667 domain-containing protein [Betaproteobacteria bacterium]
MTHPAAVPSYCRNCSLYLALASGKYCPNCGQDTATHPPSAWEFLHEFVGHYVAIEGKLARTLGLLIFRPGELTRNYLAGKKNSYVLPLRIYLTASIVFFLLVKIFGAGNLVKNEVDARVPEKVSVLSDQLSELKKGAHIDKPLPKVATTVEDKGVFNKPFLEVFECDGPSVQCNKVKAFLKDKYKDQTTSQVGLQVRDRTISMAPYAMFVCLPIFALFTRILYFNRRLYYGEHVVYAFHVHAFAFLLLLAIALTPKSISDWLYLAGAIYFWMAMRRVFGGRWLPTLLRYTVITLLYPLLLALVIFFTLVAAVFV